MATYRVGIGSFNLKDGAVGIGTESSGLGNLKVEGTYKTTDLDVTGVSTFTRYAGFAADELSISRDTSLTGEYSTLGDIVVGLTSTFTVSTGATVTVGTVESVSIGTHFSPPTGGVEDRPEVPVEGMVRFNKDLNTLEFYNGVEWRQFTVYGGSTSGRAVFGGGAPSMSTMSYVQIMTTGSTTYFGNLTYALGNVAGKVSDGKRGCFAGGGNPHIDTINYIAIASEGDATDFGNLTTAMYGMGGHSSSTRGIWAGGNVPAGQINTIQYVQIQTTGNASDFGDLTRAVTCYDCACGSPVRMLHAGGKPSAYDDVIDYWSIASKGNAVEFGNLTVPKNNTTGVSNTVRGVWCRGEFADGVNVLRSDFVTISSTGDATDFGEMIDGRYAAGASNHIRGIIVGGYKAPGANNNNIQYITIPTTGNGVDFGIDIVNRYSHSGLSDSHGGLGGY